MKSILILLNLWCFVGLQPALCAEKKLKDVTFSIDVPNPGWKVEIIELCAKDGKLLVISKASHSGDVTAELISKAESTVQTGSANADLPKKHYLLGRDWNWGKGYTAISEVERKRLIKGAESVKFTADTAVPEKDDFVGLTLEEAEALADKHSLRHRVVMVDGKSRPTTRDYRPERLNFTVVDGKVESVSKG